MELFDRHDPTGAAANVAASAALGAAAAAVAPAAGFGGWATGAVWVALFGLMGAARWLAFVESPQGERVCRWILGLIAVCWPAVVFTAAAADEGLIVVAHVAALAAAITAAVKVAPASRRAALALAPVIAWLSGASVLAAL